MFSVNVIPRRPKSGFLNNQKLINNYISLFLLIFHYFLKFFLSAYLFSKYNISKISSKQFSYFSIFVSLVSTWSSLIIFSGNIEVNPGMKKNFNECFSNFYWNRKSTFAHDYSKLTFSIYIKIFLLVCSVFII